MNENSTERLSNSRQLDQKRMVQVLTITVLFMVIEVVAAVLSKSLALLADAGHMLTDVGGIILGLIAFWFAAKPATAGKTYGYYRSEILAGFINGFILVAVSFSIIGNAWERLKDPAIVQPMPVLYVAVIGLIVNIFCLRLLNHSSHGEKKKSLNMKAAHLEIFSDALVSIGVILSSLIILLFHWYQIDALVSLAIGVFILQRTWSLLKECTNILMEGTPEHVDLESVRNAILSVSGVIDVHDIHVWTITSGLDAMSAHVIVKKEANLDEVRETVTEVLQKQFNLLHTTIQIEQASCQTDACS